MKTNGARGFSYAAAILLVVIIFFSAMLYGLWPKGKSFEQATGFDKWNTYQEIKDYVLKEFGLKVSSLYISQVKRKCGIEVGENYNLSKSENARVPQCPKEKEDAIKAALKYYAMI